MPAVPVLGNNKVSVFVFAENGTLAEYNFTVHISAKPVDPPVVTPPAVTPPVVTPPAVTPPVVTPKKSSDNAAVITVAGVTVADGDHVNLPFGTVSVPVVVTPSESHATYTVSGATGLQVGTSVLTVTVTAEDGSAKTYSYQLVVAADKSPVNLGTAGASALQQVQSALNAGRGALLELTASGANAASKVLAQVRALKGDLRASGSAAKVTFVIKSNGSSAVASLKVAP